MPLSRNLVKERVAFTVKAGGRELTVRYGTRELRFLSGPLLPAGDRFKQALGMWDNFTVAKGQDTSAWTSKRCSDVLAEAKDLFNSINAASDLFAYDYQYSFSTSPKIRNTGGTGVRVNGIDGIIDARKPGQIYFRRTDGVVLDLRSGEPLETHLGSVQIHRRRNAIDWLPKLQALIDFLQLMESEMVAIRHH